MILTDERGGREPTPRGPSPRDDARPAWEGFSFVWTRHWRLSRDPFLGPGSAYVPTSGHDEAVARLVATVESGQRLAVLRAGEGFGKSVTLSRLFAETRSPQRRFARVSAPMDGADLLAGLASGLGGRVSPREGRPAAWRALADAVRLCRWQKLHAVLIVDDAQLLDDEADRRDLERLAHLDPHPATRLTVVQSFREPDGREIERNSPAWHLTIRIPALTRSETDRYVAEKLAAAGRDEPSFTPRALGRLHEVSGGVPRGIDRLGSLALMAGAARRLEIVTPDVIDGVASECAAPWGFLAA